MEARIEAQRLSYEKKQTEERIAKELADKKIAEELSFKKKEEERIYISTENMHLMYYLSPEGKRVYTLKKVSPSGRPTVSAHPARFSPDDKYSRHRITCKRRFGLLPTQKPAPQY